MDAQERFSAYLSEHFAEYEFRITGSSPFNSDEFIVLPIMGSEASPANPDGGFVMHEPPEPAIEAGGLRRCPLHRRSAMRSMGLRGFIRGKPVKTTVSDKTDPSPLDRVKRRFKAPAPNRLWVLDFTYRGRGSWCWINWEVSIAPEGDKLAECIAPLAKWVS